MKNKKRKCCTPTIRKVILNTLLLYMNIFLTSLTAQNLFINGDFEDHPNFFTVIDPAPEITEDDYNYIFKNNTNGYKCYRIPGFITCPNGDLLAFAEARKENCDDWGYVDIVMKRSVDKGKTWGSQTVVATNGMYKTGDAAPIVDTMDPRYPNGRIFLMYNTGTEYKSGNSTKRIREVWYKTSTDNGVSWSLPVNITASVGRQYAPDYNPDYNDRHDWRSVVNGQGHGFQFKRGQYRGRLYIAAVHSVGPTPNPNDFSNYFSHCYYSDDHGDTWVLGGNIETPGGNESIAAELSDGSVLQNIRYQITTNVGSQPINTKYRLLAKSTTGGEVWSTATLCEDIPSPICHGNMISVEYDDQNILLFSHPNSQTARQNMTIFLSTDEGETWRQRYWVDSGASSYSAIYQIDNKTVGLIYERGNSGGIVFVSIPIENFVR